MVVKLNFRGDGRMICLVHVYKKGLHSRSCNPAHLFLLCHFTAALVLALS